jgi:UDP-N-acetylmuramate--alanine ligase
VPDVEAARRLGAEHLTRPQLLAQLFNEAQTGIAVGGTSGKSTVTGMIGWILHEAGRRPTVMNGAVMKNFVSPATPFASALVGDGEIFASEVDESDGSIALYRPRIAVLNNITLDHKSLDELRHLFGDFARKAERIVLNLDDDETRLLAAVLPPDRVVTYSLADEGADYFADEVNEEPFAISFALRTRSGGLAERVRLSVPGRHNVSNGLAAIAAAHLAGVPLEAAAAAIGSFQGLRRRMELVGTANGITIIDDFGHNPDKIAATLQTLHAFPGRLLCFFQPHGYGPLRVMRQELIGCFADNLGPEDVLIMPDPVYLGGTVDRSVGTAEIIGGVQALGRRAEHVPERAACGERLAELAQPGDRILIMGARDDTLSQFASDLLARLQ